MNEALTRNRDGLFLRLDGLIGKHWVLHWFGWWRCGVWADDRVQHTAKLFGIDFPMRMEPAVFDMAGRLAAEYHGGYWQFYALSNGGFYMVPKGDTLFAVSCENGFEGKLSADALGIAACLYAYSHLSFGDGEFAETVSQHYHWLREYMMGHPECRGILGAID